MFIIAWFFTETGLWIRTFIVNLGPAAFSNAKCKEVQQGVVAEVARHLPEPQQMLQRVLNKEHGHNALGGGQAGRAHPVLLQGFLVNTARTGGQQGNGPKLGKHIRSTPTACKGQLCTVQR